MVALDSVCFFGFGTGALDDIGINGTLCQPLGVLQFGRLSLEHFDKFGTDDFALAFGVGNAGEFGQELFRRIHMHHMHTEMTPHHFQHRLPLIQAQQAVIDKHASELVADGTVNQRGRHRRVHPARQPQNHFVAAHLPADFVYRFVNIVRHGPARFGRANIQHETVK